MRTPFSFPCKGEILAATLDTADGDTGVLIVTGGGQTRFGAHRGFGSLASDLVEAGYPVLRFDRRGVGDSSGEDPGFEASAPDLAAAIAVFREQCPTVRRIIGFGLCDGATTLGLYHRETGINAMILANPWVVEARANEPPPAAIGKHYREQLTSLDGWKRLMSGGIDYRKAIRGVIKLVKPKKSEDGMSLGDRVARAMAGSDTPAHIILAKNDATAVTFAYEWRKGALKILSDKTRFSVQEIDTDAHSFAREGDPEQLLSACLAAIERFEAA